MRARHTLAVALLVLAPWALGGCAVPTAQPSGASEGMVRPAPDTGEDTAPGAGAGARSDSPAEQPAAPGSAPPVPVTSAQLGQEPSQPVSRPVRLVYERLSIDVPVDALGVAPDGQMAIPEDAARAGWYRFGPTAGDEAGTAVIAAHAGSYVTPRGPFYDLREAAPGDRVLVQREDGVELAYAVVTVERTAKATIDLASHFTRDGEHRLVLFTCGGRWDEQRQSYDDNIVLTAILASG